MVISALTRYTRITDRAVWEASLGTVLPKLREIMQGHEGFISVQYLWGADEPGRIAQVTTWQDEAACRKYIREGGAATVATFEDAAVPTAAYPKGNWTRENFLAADV